MTTFELYQKIIDSLESVLSEETGEVNVVEKSILRLNETIWSPNVKIQTGFCHQKPYAFFIDPETLFTKKKTELGDFLFVVKYFDNNEIIDNRALFFQAKYSKNSSLFDIELHQFHFYKQIENIKFKFGNTVYNDLNINPIIWQNISKPNEFGDYILLCKDYALDMYTSEIAKQYKHLARGHFRYSLDLMFDQCYYHRRHRFSCSHRFSPLLDFITPFGKGNKVEKQYKRFISLIYKKLKMIPDPPEEYEGFWEESKNGGFGIVEITINNNENYKE